MPKVRRARFQRDSFPSRLGRPLADDSESGGLAVGGDSSDMLAMSQRVRDIVSGRLRRGEKMKQAGRC